MEFYEEKNEQFDIFKNNEAIILGFCFINYRTFIVTYSNESQTISDDELYFYSFYSN